MSVDPVQIKQRQRAMWSAGDYPDIATRIESASEELVARLGPGSGDEVLDVATGSGNAALAAGRRGAKVTGVDLTPELLPTARARAQAEGLEIEFLEGDAEALAFAAGSFDVVTSVFGVMFAPRQEVAVGELVRVCRPGGSIGVAAWTPDGDVGQMFATVGKHLPPPPGFVPPVLWGDEDHVRGLFAPHGVELSFERRAVIFEAESAEDWLAYYERSFGPFILARAALEPEGRYQALHDDLLAFYERTNDATDGSMHSEAEYLITVATRSG